MCKNNKNNIQCASVICRGRETFSEAGMLLSKKRKRMLPHTMKRLVYIRYEKKYRKWMDRLGVVVSEEEMKNEIVQVVEDEE